MILCNMNDVNELLRTQLFKKFRVVTELADLTSYLQIPQFQLDCELL
jgi:hypothetical protein